MKNCIDCTKELSQIEADSIYLDGKNGVLCCSCSNARNAKYRQERKELGNKSKADGKQFWADRGIAVGDKVCRFVSSMLAGGIMVYGVAKTGVNGAYVSSSFQKGQLTPHGWKKA